MGRKVLVDGTPYNCGHPRGGDNDLWFRNSRGRDGKSRRCLLCSREAMRDRYQFNRNALNFIVSMLADGSLSEGQVSRALDIDRVELRKLVDAHRAASLEAAA